MLFERLLNFGLFGLRRQIIWKPFFMFAKNRIRINTLRKSTRSLKIGLFFSLRAQNAFNMLLIPAKNHLNLTLADLKPRNGAIFRTFIRGPINLLQNILPLGFRNIRKIIAGYPITVFFKFLIKLLQNLCGLIYPYFVANY